MLRFLPDCPGEERNRWLLISIYCKPYKKVKLFFTIYFFLAITERIVYFKAMKLPVDIPKYLKRKRQERKLTLEQMAELIGRDFSVISRYEKGTVEPPYEILRRYFALKKNTPASGAQ